MQAMRPTYVPPRAPYRFLGVFRFLLASLVMVQHAGVLLPRGISDRLAPLELGGMAVFAFFIVSGFVIAEAAAAFYASRPGAFLANRLLRLVPTYLLALFVSALILKAAFPTFVPAPNEAPITPERFAVATVLANSLALFPFWRAVQTHAGVPEILEQGWALRVELLFYFAMAISIGLSVLARISLVQVLTAAGTALFLLLSLVGHYADGTALENAPYFILGVAFYYALSRQEEWWLPGAFCATALTFVAAHLAGRAPVFGLISQPRDRWGELLIVALLTASFAILACVSERPTRPWLIAKRIDRAFGDLTYPLYLLHWAVLIAAKTWLPHESATTTLVAFAAAYLVALGAALAVEQPIARLRSVVRRPRSRSGRLATQGHPAAP